MVLAGGVGRGFMTEICGGANSGDFRISDYGFRGIGYAAGEGGICGLGVKNQGRRNEEESEQGGDSAHILDLVGSAKMEGARVQSCSQLLQGMLQAGRSMPYTESGTRGES